MLPLDDTVSTGRFPFWVGLILLTNIFVFFLELTSPNPDAFIAQYALIPSQINFTNLSTLSPFITSQFLHAGFLHILSNMWFLWVFGDNVEDRLGFFLFPVFYLTSGVVGAFLQYIMVPGSIVPMLGASGAIAGVLGAYFAYFPHHKIKTLVFIFIFITIIELPASILLIYWFATQLLSGTYAVARTAQDLGGVAYYAHIGGFITGWVLAKLFEPGSPQLLEEA